jgi:L-threonylcarbamoyladenylate synthase
MRAFIRDYNHNKMRIVSALETGKIIAYPTDTLFGLGVDALNPVAVEKLFRVKQRPPQLPFSIMVPDVHTVVDLIHPDIDVEVFLKQIFPGPVTAVLPLRDPYILTFDFLQDEYAGFRIPDHPFCRWLGENYPNPVITTSANLSGQPALNTLDEIEKTYHKQIDVYIDDPVEKDPRLNKPSTVFKINKNKNIQVLREGAVPAEELIKVWKKYRSS